MLPPVQKDHGVALQKATVIKLTRPSVLQCHVVWKEPDVLEERNCHNLEDQIHDLLDTRHVWLCVVGGAA
jgi:hypothetical protein